MSVFTFGPVYGYPEKNVPLQKPTFPSRRFSMETDELISTVHLKGFGLLNHWLFLLYNQEHNFCQ